MFKILLLVVVDVAPLFASVNNFMNWLHVWLVRAQYLVWHLNGYLCVQYNRLFTWFGLIEHNSVFKLINNWKCGGGGGSCWQFLNFNWNLYKK